MHEHKRYSKRHSACFLFIKIIHFILCKINIVDIFHIQFCFHIKTIIKRFDICKAETRYDVHSIQERTLEYYYYTIIGSCRRYGCYTDQNYQQRNGS